MCGRFTLILDPEDLRQELSLGDIPAEAAQRYNVAPTQPVAAVLDPVNRPVEMLRWGLIPAWAKDPEIGNRMINARAETLAEKPAFRTAFARRRCLILADGFFEWQRPPKGMGRSLPYYFHLASGKPFAFAGLWDSWQPPEGQAVRSCTIVTCPANEMVGRLHERMPVMFTGERLWAWLSPGATPGDLSALLRPFPAGEMAFYPVSTRINSSTYSGTDSTIPVDQPGLGL